MDFSLSGEFLATSHVGEKGIHLWSNKSFFQNLIIQKVPTEPIKIDLPRLHEMGQTKQSHKDFYTQNEDDKEDEPGANMTQELIAQKFNEVRG